MRSVVFVVLLAASVSAGAQTPPRGCHDEAYAQFDFWLGQWEVRTPNGQLAGRNHIQKLEMGCLILESWTSVGGGTGQSYNYYDPAQKTWHQLWVSADGIIDYSGGLDDDGAMALLGEITYRNGNVVPFRGRWTPKDDHVLQELEQWNAEEEQWQPWFVGEYRATDGDKQ